MSAIEHKLVVSPHTEISYTEDAGVIRVFINGKQQEFDTTPPLTDGQKKQFAISKARSFYKKFLSTHFENLIFLTGAGTSFGFGGKLMRELWIETETTLTSDVLEKLCKAIGFIPEDVDFATLADEKKDLEKLLSRANIAKEFIKDYGGEPIDIPAIIETAEGVIKDHCAFTLPDDSPHEQFLNKIVHRKLKDPRVKIFTLNYDTLFEQAAVKGNFTVIDGFSFSIPRTLSGRNFDYDIVYREKSRIKEEESFVPKVFHLYKPHGSVNWRYNDVSGTVEIEENPAKPLMIFPKDSKYESSYDQPFFEMMSRFQHNLRKDNVLLVCLGFSFNDKHIVTAIQEAVAQNSSFRLLIVNTDVMTPSLKWFSNKTNKHYNVTLVQEAFEDFVVNYPTSQIYQDATVVLPETEDEQP